ncbi:MAG: cobalamin-dependent protein [Elusimicrobiota bacterium]
MPDRAAQQLDVAESRRRAAFLRVVAERPTPGPGGPPIRESRSRKDRIRRRALSFPGRRTLPKVLLFRNIIDPGPAAGSLHNATFYLASALRAAGVAVVLSDARLSRLSEKGPWGLEALGRLLKEHPDVTLAGLTLYDACFEESRRLLSFLRARTRAFTAVGGIMPTLNPREVFVHLPQAHLICRGAGELVLPEVLVALGPCDASAPLPPEQRAALAGVDGVLFGDEGGQVWAAAERAPWAADLDRSALDFSLLEKDDAVRGLCLSLSRGCRYGCSFCASMDRGRFSGKSPEAVAAHLSSYGRRLKELFGAWSRVPPAAFGVGFYDDDFLSDRRRALGILEVFKRSPFFVLFIQTAVNSFFRVRNGRPTDELDTGLLGGLSPGLFAPKVGGTAAAPPERPWVYIGTESFCDAELGRLGKGYGCGRSAKAAMALSKAGIRQAHHLIVANAETRLEDLVEGAGRIVRLQALCGEPFGLLEPPTPNLVSFYPTASWRRLVRLGLRDQVEVRRTLRLEGFPEFDYPLVDRDVPADPDAREFAARAARGELADWRTELDGLLATALLRSEELGLSGKDKARAAALRRAVDLWHRPPALILGVAE